MFLSQSDFRFVAIAHFFMHRKLRQKYELVLLSKCPCIDIQKKNDQGFSFFLRLRIF